MRLPIRAFDGIQGQALILALVMIPALTLTLSACME